MTLFIKIIFDQYKLNTVIHSKVNNTIIMTNPPKKRLADIVKCIIRMTSGYIPLCSLALYFKSNTRLKYIML